MSQEPQPEAPQPEALCESVLSPTDMGDRGSSYDYNMDAEQQETEGQGEQSADNWGSEQQVPEEEVANDVPPVPALEELHEQEPNGHFRQLIPVPAHPVALMEVGQDLTTALQMATENHTSRALQVSGCTAIMIPTTPAGYCLSSPTKSMVVVCGDGNMGIAFTGNNACRQFPRLLSQQV